MTHDNNEIDPTGGVGPIVSSAHLVAEGAAELSEFEYGLIIANNAFERWVVRCMAAAGEPELSAFDVLVLHSTTHREREKKLADIAFVLNVEDIHTVTYALRKLENLGLVKGERKGKEKFFRASEKGRGACERYRRIRDQCLINSFRAMGGAPPEVSEAARLLRARPKLDVALIDLTMPELGGVATLDQIRALAPALPVVFMSGIHDPTAQRVIEDDPNTEFLLKPFDPLQLVHRFGELAHRERRRLPLG